MRVIAGTYRGRRLRTAAGRQVRPTSDRLRETLFNVLAPRIRGSRFLDVCAGSGAVGIEALSRGAADVTLIEKSGDAIQTIEANLRALGIRDGVRLLRSDALVALDRLEKTREQYDIVFFDPPYGDPLYQAVMERLGGRGLLAAGAIVVVEHRSKHRLEPAYSKLNRYREIKQGESVLSFYRINDLLNSDSGF